MPEATAHLLAAGRAVLSPHLLSTMTDISFPSKASRKGKGKEASQAEVFLEHMYTLQRSKNASVISLIIFFGSSGTNAFTAMRDVQEKGPREHLSELPLPRFQHPLLESLINPHHNSLYLQQKLSTP